MKSIFLCKEIIINNEPIFNTVYPPEMRETLKTEAGTDDPPILGIGCELVV